MSESYIEFKHINYLIISGVFIYISLSSYEIIPERKVAIWTQFSRVTTNITSGPGIYLKSPLTKAIHVFTGIDKDEVSYTCGTLDGITFKGVVAISNQQIKEKTISTYLKHGQKPDSSNIYDMTEFLMQSICAKMTAREFLVDRFTEVDDLLYADLVAAQLVADSGLLIVEGKVKVFKPIPTNSDIANIIKKEAEHRQSTRTADEQMKLNKKMAALASATQEADEQLARDRNKAEQQRITDSQKTELEREKRLIKAEQERQNIVHEMERAKSKKDNDILIAKAMAEKSAGLEIAAMNEVLFTKEYLREKEIEATSKLNKVYYGEDLKNVFRLHNQK
jgi:hypothetical protein